MKPIFIDVEQNTDEWFDLRLKKATSSNFAKIMANYGKPFGKPAIEYAQKIALEIVTGVRDESSSFSNAFTDRGHEYEPVAIERYEHETFCKVDNGGFYYEDSDELILLGDSPDGLVGSVGCVEVKSVIPNTQWHRIEKGGIDTAYKWQIQGHMYVGHKLWCDFISFCPEMNYSKQIHICRVYPDSKMFGQIAKRMVEFRKLVNFKRSILKG